MATSARNWKKPNNFEITLPSGNVALVKRPGLEVLLAAGVMPDSLTPIAMEAIQKAQRAQPQDHKEKGEDNNSNTNAELDPEIMRRFLEKENALQDIFAAFDKVTAMCVVEPKVEYHRRVVMDSEGRPRKTVDGQDAYEDIPYNERLSSDVPETINGEPNPFFSVDPPLYTDEIDGEDKQTIFAFVSGGDDGVKSFPDSGNDVATP